MIDELPKAGDVVNKSHPLSHCFAIAVNCLEACEFRFPFSHVCHNLELSATILFKSSKELKRIVLYEDCGTYCENGSNRILSNMLILEM